MPGRYVGAEDVSDDGEPFEEKMKRLMTQLGEKFAESAKLEKTIKNNLRILGYGFRGLAMKIHWSSYRSVWLRGGFSGPTTSTCA